MLKGNNRQQVNVTLNKDVTPDSVHEVLSAIFRAHGCTGCGLMGVDVNLRGAPVEAEGIGQVNGVHSVEIAG